MPLRGRLQYLCSQPPRRRTSHGLGERVPDQRAAAEGSTRRKARWRVRRSESSWGSASRVTGVSGASHEKPSTNSRHRSGDLASNQSPLQAAHTAQGVRERGSRPRRCPPAVSQLRRWWRSLGSSRKGAQKILRSPSLGLQRVGGPLLGLFLSRCKAGVLLPQLVHPSPAGAGDLDRSADNACLAESLHEPFLALSDELQLLHRITAPRPASRRVWRDGSCLQYAHLR